jgi:hypothetical protein
LDSFLNIEDKMRKNSQKYDKVNQQRLENGGDGGWRGAGGRWW